MACNAITQDLKACRGHAPNGLCHVHKNITSKDIYNLLMREVSPYITLQQEAAIIRSLNTVDFPAFIIADLQKRSNTSKLTLIYYLLVHAGLKPMTIPLLWGYCVRRILQPMTREAKPMTMEVLGSYLDQCMVFFHGPLDSMLKNTMRILESMQIPQQYCIQILQKIVALNPYHEMMAFPIEPGPYDYILENCKKTARDLHEDVYAELRTDILEATWAPERVLEWCATAEERAIIYASGYSDMQ